MGYYIGIVVLIGLALLDNSLLVVMRDYLTRSLEISQITGQPSLVLLAVLAWSWHAHLNEAVFWAFVGGIALDLLNPIMPTGVSVLALLVTIFTIKTVERLFYEVNIFALFAFVIVATILHHGIIYTAFTLQGITLNFSAFVSNYSVPTLAFNLLGILPMYVLLRRLQKRLPQQQSSWDTDLRVEVRRRER